MKVLAIIPARGGSKGIPLKNLVICGGRPLVDWVIQAVNDSELVTLGVLSSDHPDILDRACGKVLASHRPPELAEDDTPTEAVMDYVIGDADDYDVIVLLQPTSPMVTGEDIDGAIEMLVSRNVGSVLSVVPTHVFLWDDQTYPYDPEDRPRRQEFEKYQENGAIYATTMDAWRDSGCRISGWISFYEMDEETRIEVDTETDLFIVDALLRRREACLKIKSTSALR